MHPGQTLNRRIATCLAFKIDVAAFADFFSGKAPAKDQVSAWWICIFHIQNWLYVAIYCVCVCFRVCSCICACCVDNSHIKLKRSIRKQRSNMQYVAIDLTCFVHISLREQTRPLNRNHKAFAFSTSSLRFLFIYDSSISAVRKRWRRV